jgi:hypothetical protein
VTLSCSFKATKKLSALTVLYNFKPYSDNIIYSQQKPKSSKMDQQSQSTMYVVRQRWQGFKDNDRNFVAAFFHMCTVALVCTSLAALGWFRLRGAPCSPHLAVYQFFSYGHFSMDSNPSIPEIVSSKAVISPLISQYHSSTGGLLTLF